MSVIVVGNIPPPVDGPGMVTTRAMELIEREFGLDLELFDCFDDEGRTYRELFSYGRALLRVLKATNDTLYIQGVQGERMLFVLALLLCAKLSSTPVLHHHHGFKLIYQPSFLWRMICSRRFNATHLVLSKIMGEQIESIYGNRNWKVVSNAAFVRDDFLYQDHDNTRSDDLTVLFAGVAGVGKGEDILVEAVRRVRSLSRLRIKLILAGREHKSTESFVKPVGVLSSSELANYMRRSDVLVLPSKLEAAPMVLYEAAACGLPSIASPRGCIPEMSDELGGVITTAEPEVLALTDALLNLFQNTQSAPGRVNFDTAHREAIEHFSSLLTEGSEANELSRVLLAQLIGAPYRAEVFSQAAGLGCSFVWGDKHFEEHIVSVQSMEGVSPKLARNRFFLGRQLVWQTGSFKKMLSAHTLVIEANPRWLNSVLIALVRKCLRRRTIFWGHFDHHGDAGGLRKFVRNAYQRLPNCWMAYTESEAIRFRELGLQSVAAPNPLPPCSDPEFVVSGEGEDLLFLGRIDKNKALDVALHAIASVPGETRLHVVGDGPDRLNTIKLATELGIADRVDFHGFLPCNEELHSIMKRCYCIVIPTYVGLNLTQAMAHGLGALVNSDCSHSPEIEVARRFPENILEHDGSPPGVAKVLNLRTRRASLNEAPLIRDLYRPQQWLNGLVSACIE